MSTEFCKVVTVLRLNDFSVFGLRRLNAVPCHSLLEGCVVSDVLFARRGWGEWCLWDFSLVSVAFW
jgi:hypothetical protein